MRLDKTKRDETKCYVVNAKRNILFELQLLRFIRLTFPGKVRQIFGYVEWLFYFPCKWQSDLSHLAINKNCCSYFSVRISVGLGQTHHELPSLFSYRWIYMDILVPVLSRSKCLRDPIKQSRSILMKR